MLLVYHPKRYYTLRPGAGFRYLFLSAYVTVELIDPLTVIAFVALGRKHASLAMPWPNRTSLHRKES